MMEECGYIVRDKKAREIYLVLETDNEVYLFDEPAFQQALTRYVRKGCKLSDIMELIPPDEAEGLK